MASTTKSLTQKVLFPAAQSVFMELHRDLMVKQGLDKGSAASQTCKIASF